MTPVPYSKEAERSLVGALVLTPSGLPVALELVAAADLYGPRERRIFEAVVTLVERGQPVDVATVAIEAATDRRTVTQLVADCPASSNVAHYAGKVAEMAQRRRVLAAGQRLIQAAADGELDAIEEVRTLLEASRPGFAAGTSWQAANLALVLAGETLDDESSMLVRNDGVTLIYPARVHAFNAEPETGKTWLALTAAAERIGIGEHVLYVDFEDRPASIVARLLALGLEPAAVLHFFHYVRPDEPLSAAGRAALAHLVAQYKPSLAVLDGVTEALVLHGWDLRDNTDVARFMAALPRPLARDGAAVILIDHVGRDREARGRYAIGAQAKLAGIDVAYCLESVKPFGRGLEGVTRISVAKDRPGQVRQYATDGRIGEFHLRSRDDGLVEAELVAPQPETEFRPTALMEKLSRILELNPAGLNRREVRSALAGSKNETKDLALATLIAEGYVTVQRAGAAHMNVSVKRYRQNEDDHRE